MTDKQFTIVREFDAPRETIWRAWVDPSLAAKWWHPHGLITPPESVKIDLREGGTYEYNMVLEDTGQSWPTAGIYLEVREPDRLKFTWAEPDSAVEESPIITIDLRELEGDRCEMTFHVLGIEDNREEEHNVYDGWLEAFEELDSALGVAATR